MRFQPRHFKYYTHTRELNRVANSDYCTDWLAIKHIYTVAMIEIQMKMMVMIVLMIAMG
jgi:hypothetical protein